MKSVKKIGALLLATTLSVGAIIPLVSCSSTIGDDNKTAPDNQSDIKITKPSYASLGITGKSHFAVMTTPPKETKKYGIEINRTKGLANTDVITIRYRNKNVGGTVNGKTVEEFTYIVKGLSEKQTINITINKPTIDVKGFDGTGTFTKPVHANGIVTTTQSKDLSNGDRFSITFRANEGFTFNGKSEVTFTYEVKGLKTKIVDVVANKPNLVFIGINGSGSFTLPKINHTKVTADKSTGLSNNDEIVLTITADKNFTINGNATQKFTYKVSGLTHKANNGDVEIIRKTQGYDVNDIHTKTVIESSGQKTVVGYFGTDYHKSPIVFSSGYTTINGTNFNNAPTSPVPFITKSEMPEFIKLFLSQVVHGPELPTLGLISIDSTSLIKASSGERTSGWLLEEGLSRGGDFSQKYVPDNKAKSLLSLNSKVITNYIKASFGISTNYNNINSKFNTIFNTLQHEYGHNLSNYLSVQAPNYLDSFRTQYPNELYNVGMNNGYRDSKNQNNTFLPQKFIKSLGRALGVDLTSANDQNTILSDLLARRDALFNKGLSTKSIETKLSLWLLRTMIGKFDDNAIGILNRNKSFLYPGHKMDEKFKIKFTNYYWLNDGSGDGGSFSAGIFNDYSSGFNEMMTRILTFLTTRSPCYWRDEVTSIFTMTGLNPYYKYKKGTYNFSSIEQSGGLDPSFKNGWTQTGDEFGIHSSNQQSLVDVKVSKRESNLDKTKRDNMINLFKDTLLGYGKTISFFSKRNQGGGNAGQQHMNDAQKHNQWSQNMIGGWTANKHQYLLSNYYSDGTEIENTNTSIAYEISDPNAVVSFRRNGAESNENRTLNFDANKAWYVDLSSTMDKTENTFNDLMDNPLSFWDDKNDDGRVQSAEITPIAWSEVNSMFPSAKVMFPGGSSRQIKTQSIQGFGGKVIYGNNYDLSNPFLLKERNGNVILTKEKY